MDWNRKNKTCLVYFACKKDNKNIISINNFSFQQFWLTCKKDQTILKKLATQNLWVTDLPSLICLISRLKVGNTFGEFAEMQFLPPKLVNIWCWQWTCFLRAAGCAVAVRVGLGPSAPASPQTSRRGWNRAVAFIRSAPGADLNFSNRITCGDLTWPRFSFIICDCCYWVLFLGLFPTRWWMEKIKPGRC